MDFFRKTIIQEKEQILYYHAEAGSAIFQCMFSVFFFTFFIKLVYYLFKFPAVLNLKYTVYMDRLIDRC